MAGAVLPVHGGGLLLAEMIRTASARLGRLVIQSTSGRSTKSGVRSFTLSVSRLHSSTSWIHCLHGRLTSFDM
jgi:hypothetical protein